MKKSFIVFVSFFLPFLFFSCASIPELSEPKNDTDCLLYGKVFSCSSVYCYDSNEIDIDKTIYINLTSYEDPSEATQWHVDWDREFQKVHAEFFRRHPDSKWLGKKWITRHESLEHHLTLFP